MAESSSVKQLQAMTRSASTKMAKEWGMVENSTQGTTLDSSQSTKPRRTAGSIPDRPTQNLLPALDPKSSEGSLSKSKRKRTSSNNDETAEKRLRMFRKAPSQKYLEKLGRARTQRMFVISRKKGGTEEIPEETFTMVGSVGNIYEVSIKQVLECTCPDSRGGNHCKHLVYVMHKVLKAPERLQYQIALVASELREIFQNAPPSPTETATTDDSGKRKPIDGDCPICFTPFDPQGDELVWCESACGNNIHKTCFDQWAATTRSRGVTCVYCRAPWQSGSADEIVKNGMKNAEGYINVATEYGMSGVRDYSSYNQYWVRRQDGRGYY